MDREVVVFRWQRGWQVGWTIRGRPGGGVGGVGEALTRLKQLSRSPL